MNDRQIRDAETVDIDPDPANPRAPIIVADVIYWAGVGLACALLFGMGYMAWHH